MSTSPGIEREEVGAFTAESPTPRPDARRMNLTITGFLMSKDRNLTSLPNIKDASSVSERDGLFIKKLEQCCTLFDYVTCPPTDLNSKEVKSEALIEMRDFIKAQNDISKCIYPAAVKMLSVNLIGNISPSMLPMQHPEDPIVVSTLEAAWPHMKLVFEMFLSLLESPNFDTSIGEIHFDTKFVMLFVELFDCEDPTKRQYLRHILQAMHTKLIKTRACIGNVIVNTLYTFVYETEYDNGICEMLEIMGSIIDGLPLPLTQDQRHFLLNILMPLHKTSFLERTAPDGCHILIYCVLGFIEKDHTLTVPVVKQLLRFWPKRNANKELFFIQQLGAIMEVMGESEYKCLQHLIRNQMFRCTTSHNTEKHQGKRDIRHLAGD